jgi:hypothetical protein
MVKQVSDAAIDPGFIHVESGFDHGFNTLSEYRGQP